MSFIDPTAKLFVSLIPDDARLLRQIYAQNATNSQLTGWCSLPSRVIIPRFVVAPMAIPTALATGASYGVRGLSRGAVKMMNMKFEKALDAFCNDTLKAIQCTILGVASIAYAVLGALFGARVFKKFVPNPIEKDLPEEISKAEAKVARLKEKLKGAREQIQALEAQLVKLPKEGEKEVETEEFLRIKVELQRAAAKVIELEEQIATSSGEESKQVNLLNIKLGKKISKLKVAREAEKAKKAEKVRLEIDLEQAQEKIRQLEAEPRANGKEDKDAEIRKLRNQVMDTREQQKTIKRLNSIIKQKENEFNQLNSKLIEFHARFMLLEERIPDAKEGQAKQRIESFLQAQIREQTLKLEQMQQTLQNANEELAQLRKQRNGEERSPGEKERDLQNSMLSSVNWEEITDPGPIDTSTFQQPLSLLERAQGMIVNTTVAAFTKAGQVVTGVYDTVSDVTKQFLVDGKELWKEMRYAVAINQLLKVVGQAEFDEISRLLEPYEAFKEGTAKHIAIHLRSAIATLQVPEGTLSSRTQFQAFQKSLREGLRLLQSTPNHGIDPDLRKRIDAINYHWFTSLQMVTFFFELVTYIASKGNAKIIDTLGLRDGISNEPSLSKKLRLLLDGIKHVSKEHTAPTADTTLEKAGTILSSFDPMFKNIPNLGFVTRYEKEGDEPREVRHVRTGVPVGPKKGGLEGAKEPWEIESISLIPEYLSYLRSLGDRGEKLMTFLHLNPKYYNQQTGEVIEPVAPSCLERLDPRKIAAYLHELQKYREALWIKLIVDLSKYEDFKNILSVALFPMDGEWFEGVQSEEKAPKNRFIEKLVDAFADENGSFIIPGMNANQKREFAIEIAERVSKEYFYPLDEEDDLDKDQKLAFYGSFFSLAKEELYIRDGATIVEDRCKDGVDRTEGLVGAELIEKISRLDRTPAKPIGRLEDRETQDQIIGTTLGPALGILKRAVLEGRFVLLEAKAKHTEWLKEHEVKRKSYAPYTVDGFRLVDVAMGGDETQTLYPAPSKAKNETDYLKLLAFEAEHPFTLPASRKLPGLLISECIQGKIGDADDLYDILNRILPTYYVLVEKECVQFDMENPSQKFGAIISEVLTEDRARHHALIAATPYIWNTPYEMLKDRYANALYRVISPQDRQVESPVQTYKLYKSEPAESRSKGKDMLAIEHSFPICRRNDLDIVAYAKVSMSIDLEDPDSHFVYSYKILNSLEGEESGSSSEDEDHKVGLQRSKEDVKGKRKQSDSDEEPFMNLSPTPSADSLNDSDNTFANTSDDDSEDSDKEKIAD